MSFKERTDVTAVPAMGVVAETMVALVLADEALRKFGGDSRRASWCATPRPSSSRSTAATAPVADAADDDRPRSTGTSRSTSSATADPAVRP